MKFYLKQVRNTKSQRNEINELRENSELYRLNIEGLRNQRVGENQRMRKENRKIRNEKKDKKEISNKVLRYDEEDSHSGSYTYERINELWLVQTKLKKAKKSERESKMKGKDAKNNRRGKKIEKLERIN